MNHSLTKPKRATARRRGTARIACSSVRTARRWCVHANVLRRSLKTWCSKRVVAGADVVTRAPSLCHYGGW